MFSFLRSLLRVFGFLAIGCSAAASDYRIVFEEGAYPYNFSKPTSDIDNKYLAKVTLFKDGRQLLEVRGSTIPDAYWFYSGWHTANKAHSPNDADIREIEGRKLVVQKEIGFGNEANLKNLNHPEKMTAPDEVSYADLDVYFNSVPVLPSGRYRFVMGFHHADDPKCWKVPGYRPSQPQPGPILGLYKCHGMPHVPVLLGTQSEEGWDGTRPDGFHDGQRLSEYGWLVSLNRNKEWEFRRMARYIHVHDGRATLDTKDSEGCLTIRPSDWPQFVASFPAPDSWNGYDDRGIVEIKREVKDSSYSTVRPSAPIVGQMPKAPGGFRFIP